VKQAVQEVANARLALRGAPRGRGNRAA
jgi:hypothetical protein